MQIFGGVNASLSSRAGNSDPSESYLGPISYQPEELLRGGNDGFTLRSAPVVTRANSLF
jgi:hypothetical protein